MGVKDEFLFDFNIHRPRLLISGHTGVIDNVKKIVMLSDTSIIVDTGGTFMVINGTELIVDQLEDARMLVSGEIKGVEFYRETKHERREKKDGKVKKKEKGTEGS